MQRRDALLSLGALLAAPRASLRARQQPGSEQFDALMESAGVPSFAMVRVQGGRVTHLTRGVRRKGDPAPTSPETVYAAASLSKVVFAYAFLGLVHEGVLSLDRPVAEYLDLPNPTDPRARTITARHLLSHSSGWRNWRNSATDSLVATFDPGTRWLYSGEGYYLLQRIMEKVTGKAMSLVCRERVFEPLGMTRSSLAGLEALDPHMASGHNVDGEPRPPFGRPTQLELRRQMTARGLTTEHARVEDAEAAMRVAEPALPVLPNFLAPNAAASLVTTSADFGKFLAHVLQAPRLGGMPAAIATQMFAPQVRRNAAIQWGLGVGLETIGGRNVGWQWGDNPGFKNFVYIDLSGGDAAAIFTNGDRGARIYERVLRTMTGIDHPAFIFV